MRRFFDFLIFFFFLKNNLFITSNFFSIPNSFNLSSFKWNNKLCLLAWEETRKLPPIECLEALEQKIKKKKTNFHNNRTLKMIMYEEFIPKQTIRTLLITGVPRSGTTMFSALASNLGIPLSNDAHPSTWFGKVSWALAAPPTIDPMCPTSTPNTTIILNQTNIIRNSSKTLTLREQLAQYHQQKVKEVLNITDPPPIQSTLRFEHIFHQVRDPLASIPSLATVIQHWKRCKKEISQITPEMNFDASPEHMALQIWVEWNSRLDKYPFIPIYRVEDFNILDLLRGINYQHEITEYDFQCAYRKFFGYNTRTSNTRQQITWKHIFHINTTLGRRALDMAYNYGYRYYKNSTMVHMFPKMSQMYQIKQQKEKEQKEKEKEREEKLEKEKQQEEMEKEQQKKEEEKQQEEKKKEEEQQQHIRRITQQHFQQHFQKQKQLQIQHQIQRQNEQQQHERLQLKFQQQYKFRERPQRDSETNKRFEYFDKYHFMARSAMYCNYLLRESDLSPPPDTHNPTHKKPLVTIPRLNLSVISSQMTFEGLFEHPILLHLLHH